MEKKVICAHGRASCAICGLCELESCLESSATGVLRERLWALLCCAVWQAAVAEFRLRRVVEQEQEHLQQQRSARPTSVPTLSKEQRERVRERERWGAREAGAGASCVAL